MVIADWKGVEGRPIITRNIKLFARLFAVIALIYFGGVIYFSKGDKPWSTWLINQAEIDKKAEQDRLAMQQQKPPSEKKMRRFLIPAKDVISSKVCHSLPSSAIVAYFGGSVGYSTRTSFNLLRIDNENVISIDRTSDGLQVNATLRDSKGNEVASIKKNIFTAMPTAEYEPQSPDPHTIQVFNQKDEIVLFVRYSNDNAIKVFGTFGRRNSTPIIINEAQQVVGNSNCFGEMSEAIFSY